MSKTYEFTDESFQREVLESQQPVLVDFWAEWCGPCRAVGPTIEQLAEEHGQHVKVGKLNIELNPLSPRGYQIQSIPAVLLFKNGEVVETLVGVQPKDRYEEAIRRHAA